MAKKNKQGSSTMKIADATVGKSVDVPAKNPATPITGRVLILQTDGNTVNVLTNTMGLLEVKQALEMTLAQVVVEINARAAQVNKVPEPEAPVTKPDAKKEAVVDA